MFACVWLAATLLWQGDENVLQRLWHLSEPLRFYVNYTWKVGNFPFSIASLAFGLVIVVVAVFVSRYLRGFVERRMSRHKHLDPGVQFTILRLVHYLIMTVGVFAALRIAIEADFTSLAVVFTALSIGIGFGLQFIAGDIASGFIILFERPVRVGDYITIPGPDGKLTEGRVRSINLRTTIVITNDNIASVVPNSKIVNQNFLNWTFRERRTRVSIPIGVASDSDPELVRDTLLRAAEGVQFLLEEPKPSVQFLDFGDYDLKFRLLVWTDKPRRHPSIKSDINYNIARLFREADIEIPNPQRDINLRSGSLRLDPREGLLSADGDAEEEAEARR
ncbi:MAG TPA: mechanosensitive ion channel domain-containing protein [Pyrinomonadaceae bacterium]|jgi:small-conductance mechanosensitive channel|nr:mechanosensitive ion channel domain-containing protein [Pyrinomonadaceae bacterium]